MFRFLRISQGQPAPAERSTVPAEKALRRRGLAAPRSPRASIDSMARRGIFRGALCLQKYILIRRICCGVLPGRRAGRMRLKPLSLSRNPGVDKGPQPLMFHPALTTSASERMNPRRVSYFSGFAARERMQEAKSAKLKNVTFSRFCSLRPLPAPGLRSRTAAARGPGAAPRAPLPAARFPRRAERSPPGGAKAPARRGRSGYGTRGRPASGACG